MQSKLAKTTLRELDKKFIGLKAAQNSTPVLQVVIHGGAINQYIIKEYDDKVAKKRLQDVVHGTLKCGWSIC